MAVRKKATTKRKAVKKTSSSRKSTTRVKVRRVAAGSKKKAAAKSKPRKSTRAKTSAKKTAKSSLSRVSTPYTKTELLRTISERTDLQKKDVASVIEELAVVMEAHIRKGGAGQFTLPGILKMTVKKTPARKARKGINPFTGEETIFKAKPASRKVKILALKKLKEMATA